MNKEIRSWQVEILEATLNMTSLAKRRANLQISVDEPGDNEVLLGEIPYPSLFLFYLWKNTAIQYDYLSAEHGLDHSFSSEEDAPCAECCELAEMLMAMDIKEADCLASLQVEYGLSLDVIPQIRLPKDNPAGVVVISSEEFSRYVRVEAEKKGECHLEVVGGCGAR